MMARRKGHAPVRVATKAQGIEVVPDDEAVEHGVPPRLQVFFEHGGSNRRMRVVSITADSVNLDIFVFQEKYAVQDHALGRWIRAAVERALDAAAR